MAENGFKIMPIFSYYRKFACQNMKKTEKRTRYSRQHIKKCKPLPKNPFLPRVTPQISRFVKQKSNVITF